MSILGERFFELSNALFCYHLTTAVNLRQK